jgi:hypothetical protein
MLEREHMEWAAHRASDSNQCDRFGTGPAGLVVPAAMEMPVGLELGATDTLAELLFNVRQLARPCRSM